MCMYMHMYMHMYFEKSKYGFTHYSSGARHFRLAYVCCFVSNVLFVSRLQTYCKREKSKVFAFGYFNRIPIENFVFTAFGPYGDPQGGSLTGVVRERGGAQSVRGVARERGGHAF